MIAMTEAQALAEGLTVMGPDGVPAYETPADRAERCAVAADELAAVVESMLAAGRVTRRGLEVIRDGLGELHVECDQLAEDVRQLEHGHSDDPADSWAGVA
jgi:hypothetical protein